MNRFTIAAFCLMMAASVYSRTIPDEEVQELLESLTTLTSQRLAQRASQWECTPSVRYVCTSEGCQRHPPLVFVRLDLAEKTYSRCDSKGCDTFPMTFSAGGIYTTFNQPSSGSTFLKVLNDGSEYLEVVSSLNTVYQYFGACRPSR